MRPSLLHRLGRWLAAKTAPGATPAGAAGGFVDSHRRLREPSARELLQELKGAAWACISINSSVCASYPPALYVATHAGQARPKCATKALKPAAERRLRGNPQLPTRLKTAESIEQVLEHPLLDLLARVNPVMNAFDLWELTTLYQEVHGSAFWLLEPNALGVPGQVWVLPSQHVTPHRSPGSGRPVDWYEYRCGTTSERYAPEDVIHFRYPDPRDPYGSGLSPLRASWEQVTLSSEYSAFKVAKFRNRALPDAILSPEEVIGEEERDRLELEWNAKLGRGGNGKVIVADSPLRMQLIEQSMGDLAALAEQGRTKEDIANAFHVPVAYLTTQTNLANLRAAESQHMMLGILPRLRRRDEKLNEQLVPLFDPGGRLFLASDDPKPLDADADNAEITRNLKFGVVTINEQRGAIGLPPVPWGDKPWLPLMWAPTDYEGRAAWPGPEVGRNRPVEDG